jgi:mannan endo-1,4-beta-mannosidase
MYLPASVVTTGMEGFFGPRSPWASANPEGGWAANEGQDFEADHDSDAIDFTVIHCWPDNWRSDPSQPDWVQNWIRTHQAASEALGKPMLVQEFGKLASDSNILQTRDPYYAAVYESILDSVESGGALRGALFWRWEAYEGGKRESTNRVKSEDSTFTEHIAPFSRRVEAFSGAQSC